MNPRTKGRAYSASKGTRRMVAKVDGQRISYIKGGEGSPAIVFLSGAGMDLDSWFLVYPQASRISTTVAFDRPGVGKSGPPRVEQTAATIVATLRSLLRQAVVPSPYVLVAHSLGGLSANFFARQFPGEICGMVLVDSASPEEIESQPPPGRFATVIDKTREIFDRMRSRPRLREVDVVAKTVQQIADAPPFPDVPLVVVTGAKRMPFVPEAAFAAHAASQARLRGLSPGGRQVMAPRSGHFPQLHDPEVVLDAIRDVVLAARS